MADGPPQRRTDPDGGDVDRSLETIEDPEYSPQSPSAALAAQAAALRVVAAVRSPGMAELVRLAWPVMLSQIVVTAVALIDIAMVGRLGPNAVAAVGYATQFFFMTQSALFAVGFACVALMARAIGANDPILARRALAASLWVGVGTAGLVAAGVLLWPRAVLQLLSAHPDVIELTVPYLQLLLGSTLLLAVALVLENGLRANRDTVTPMRIASVVAGVKIVLNALLIFGALGMPRLELVGAGIATVISQMVGVAMFVTVAARQPAGSAVRLHWRDLVSAGPLIGRVVRVAMPGVTERILLNLALLSYFAVLARYGTVAVAAYTVGVRAVSFSWIPGTGFAAAVATLVGQALGAGDSDEAERIGRRAAGLALTVALALGVVVGVARGPISGLFTTDADTLAALNSFLFCLALAQPMLQLHFTLAGVHRGAGDTWTPLAASTVGNWGIRVPVAVIAAYVLEVDLAWLWAIIIFDHLARATWLTFTFRRGAWKTRL